MSPPQDRRQLRTIPPHTRTPEDSGHLDYIEPATTCADPLKVDCNSSRMAPSKLAA